MIIRRIGVLSVAKITAIIAAAFGLLAGIMIFLVGSAASVATSSPEFAGSNDAGMAWLSGLGALAIIVVPIFYAVVGFIGGAIQALVYNIAAKFVGGVSFETE